MARGRMLNKSISMSQKFGALPDDTCRLLATWTIANLDVRGVFYGRPGLVKAQVFPERDDVTTAQVKGYLEAMQAVGLIRLFEAAGTVWQYWPGFVDNQVGLRVERETSDFPYPPEDSGVLPETIPQDSDTMPDDAETTENTDENEDSESIRQVSGNIPASIRQTSRRSISTSTKEVQVQDKKDSAKADPKQKPRDPIFDKLADMTQADPKLQGGLIARTKKQLGQVNATFEDLSAFEAYWRACDWRGQKGQAPSLPQITNEWGKFKAWCAKGRPDPARVERVNPRNIGQL